MAAKPTVLIMAAGHGTRMKSDLPKVLHSVCGRPMIEWVILSSQEAGAGKVAVVVRPGSGVADGLPDGVAVVEQTEGEGTGNAVLAARGEVEGGTVVILSGDHPLISAETIAGLVAAHEQTGAAATLLTTEAANPAGYGRVVRAGDGTVERIVETKHTDGVDPAHLEIREVNMGTYAFDADILFEALEAVGEEHGERYLTAVFELFGERGVEVAAHRTDDFAAAMGVNDRIDLAEVERHARDWLAEWHIENGVTVTHPGTVTIDADVELAPGTVLEPGTVLRGSTVIGEGCTIGPNSVVIDSQIGDGVEIKSSWLDQAKVADGASIGPFAYLRPGADIGAGAKIGTFVEIKNSVIGAGTKVPHLTYLGDADVGEGSNIAAGNITANYDGRAKHRTVIGNRVKTSVDTSFVAPVHVGDGAYTGAGSVITEDIPPGALGIARARQRNVEDYAERVDKERAQDEQQP